MIKKLRLILVMVAFGTAFQIVSQFTRLHKTSYQNKSPDRDAVLSATDTSTINPTSSDNYQFSFVHTDRMIVVQAAGDLSERLKRFNDAIDRVRADVLQQFRQQNFIHVDFPDNQLRIVDDNYVDELSKFARITTVVLPWRNASTAADDLNANLHLQTYFPWTGTRLLCTWLRSAWKPPGLYLRVFRKMSCNENVADAIRPTRIRYGHLKANNGLRQMSRFYTEPPSSVVHLHVITGGGYIDERGHIATGDVRIIFDYCYRIHDVQTLTRQTVESAAHYDEVFAMKHSPGGAFYHGVVEEMPRIAAFVPFLRRHRQVRVHVTRTHRAGEFLRVLGIDPSRAVSGPVTANVIYMPRPASCMMPRVLETQLLSDHCLRYMPSHRPRNRLILILRSGKRRFANQPPVVRVIRSAADDFGLRYTEFRDDPPPSFNRTMTVFHEAVMVVAAHGAGLSNLLYSRPGVFVVEIVPNTFITPMCFLQLSHGLGHHWHGIAVRHLDPHVVRVDIRQLRSIVRDYLQVWRNNNTKSS